MAVNGRCLELDEWQMRLQTSVSESNGSGTYTAELTTAFTDDTTTELGVPWITLTGNESADTVNVLYEGYDAPFGGYSVSVSNWDLCEAVIKLIGVKVYGLDTSNFKCEVGSIELWINGALEMSFSGWNENSAATGPFYLFYLGCAPRIHPTAASGCKMAATGGLRWIKDGSPVTFPVTLPPMDDFPDDTPGPGGGGTPTNAPFNVSPVASVSATDSWTCTALRGVEVLASGPGGSEQITYEGWVEACPDLSHEMVRMAPEYEALIHRYGIPGARITASRSWTYAVPFSIQGKNQAVEVYPRMAEIVGNVGNATHALEDALALPTYAPCYSRTVHGRIDASNQKVETVVMEFPGELDTALGAAPGDPEYWAGVFPPMDHVSRRVRYYGFWPNRFWCFYLVNAGDDPQWGSLGTLAFYHPRRNQYTYLAALPSGEQTKRLAKVVADLYGSYAYSAWIDAFVAYGYGFLGLSRWTTRTPTWPAYRDMTSASADLWTGDDCSLSHGSKITVTPSASPCRVTLDLGDYNKELHQWPHLGREILIGWGPGFTSLKVYAVDTAGNEIEVHDTGASPSAGTTVIEKPGSQEYDYAGSWGIDNGLGVPDGVDNSALAPEGLSSGIMAIAERAFAFALTHGYTCTQLIFEIEAAGTVDLDYPRFYRPAGDHAVVVETAKACSILWEDAPGVRFGNQAFVAGGSITTTPPVVGLCDYDQTIPDAMAFCNVTFEGLAPGTNVTSDLAAMFDSFEGQAIGQNDGNQSHAFMLPGSDVPKLALVNPPANPPPSWWNPTDLLDDDWEPTGTYGQTVYSWVQGKNLYPSRAGELHLFEGTTRRTDEHAAPINGWFCTELGHPLELDEGTDWIARGGGRDLAEVTPWNGYFSLFHVLQEGGAWVTEAVAPDRRRVMIYASASGPAASAGVANATTVYSRIMDVAFNTMDEVSLGIEAEWGAVAIGGPSTPVTVILVTEEAGSIIRRVSTDSGRTFGSPTTIGSGSKPTLTTHPDGIEYDYWVDGSAIKGARRDREGTALEATFTAVASGVDDAAISAQVETLGAGAKRIVLRYFSGGTLTRKESTDGITFV